MRDRLRHLLPRLVLAPSFLLILFFVYGFNLWTLLLSFTNSKAFTNFNFIGWANYMTGAQVVAAQDAGVEIGSHTVSHVNLTTQSPYNLAQQLTQSKQVLEALLGRPVISFCYPSGKFGAREMVAVEAAGYQDATTTYGGTWHSLRDRYAWTRVRINGGANLNDFATAVQSGA